MSTTKPNTPKRLPAPAKCIFRSARGSRAEFTGDIPTALLIGFHALDEAQRIATLEKLTQAHQDILKNSAQPE